MSVLLADILAARRTIAGVAVRTPLVPSPHMSAVAGSEFLLKLETTQPIGAFKLRGALNAVAAVPAGAAGVTCCSTGNHGRGVAWAARARGLRAVVCMSALVPQAKVDGIRALGAEVRIVGRSQDDALAESRRLAREEGLVEIPPFDDPLVIAGQGTIGLEIAEQAAELGAALDAVLVCCGGGGLVSGTALALSEKLPGVPVYSVEPAGFDDTARSLASGSRIANDMSNRSICDALLAEKPGEITFELNRRLLKAGLVVSDAEAQIGMAHAFRYLKLVAEPGGAVALAAAVTGKIDMKGKTVAVVCSGGNVDQAAFLEALTQAGEV